MQGYQFYVGRKSPFEDIFDSFFSTSTQVVDTDRYEIKEKPEWKKKMLEQEISTLDSKVSHYQSQIEHLLGVQSEFKTQKKDLEKQLKEL